MEQLKIYLAKIRDGFWTVVSKIESSEAFERLVSKYEALPTRQQKTIKSVSTFIFILIFAWIAVSPFVSTRSLFKENRDFFNLLSSMKLFNSKLEAAKKEYIPPIGWQNISAADINQLQESISNVMASLGIAEDQYEIAPQGETLLVHAKEATIKQLESFMFQIDGLYPRFSIVRNKTSVHPQNKELVAFEIEIGPGENTGGIFAERPNFQGQDSDFDSMDEGFDGPGVMPPTPSNSDFGSDDLPSAPPTPPSDGTVPGFEPPTFSPLDGDTSGDFAPSNRNGDFIPPMGDDFIPPPPPNPDDESFDVVPLPDEDFPPLPAE